MAWLGTYAKRIKVTASNTNVDSDLTHFPLLLKLGTSVGTGSTDVSCVFDELTSDANRTKIAVTKTDGTTELYVEIEKWDDANEKAVLWVSKSDWVLDTDADTELYLYYDSAHAANTDRVGDTNSVVAESVWDANYKMVQHLADGASTSATYDSTSNDNDGTKTGANAPNQIDGEIGKGQDFDGTDDVITVSDNAGLSTLGPITLECWVNFTNNTKKQGLLSKDYAGTDREWIILYSNTPYVGLYLFSADGLAYLEGATNVVTVTDGEWHQILTTWDGINAINHINIWIDGVSRSINVYDVKTNTGYVPHDSDADIDIGRYYGSDTYSFDGNEDEVRISNIKRTDAWIKANFYTQTDALVSWGSEEDIPTTTDTGNFFIMF